MDRITNPELEGEDPREFIEGDLTVPATPLAIKWLNAVQSELIAFIEASGQIPNENDVQQLLKAFHLMAPKGVQIDEIKASGTWVKPEGATLHQFIVVGQGAGGASGEVGSLATVTRGGPGGGGGAVTIASIPSSTIDESCAVVVGTQAGKGGESSSNGISKAGQYGSSSSIRLAPYVMLYAEGAPNTSVNPHPQGGYGGGYRGSLGLYPGGRGGGGNAGPGNSGSNTFDAAAASRGGGAGGGGGGGGLGSNNTTQQQGGPGGATVLSGYSSDTSPPGENAQANNIHIGYVGAGGIGGGSSSTGDGGKGGNGASYGGGGGGGGAARTGFLSGAGGDGAPGIVVVITYF